MAALAFFVQGYFDREDFGLEVPEDAAAANESFQAKINPLNEFVKSEVIFDDGTNKEGKVTYEVRCSIKDLFDRVFDS